MSAFVALVGDLLFEIGALEVDVLDVFAFQNQMFLIFKAHRTFADAFVLELRLDLEYTEVAKVRGAWSIASSYE